MGKSKKKKGANDTTLDDDDDTIPRPELNEEELLSRRAQAKLRNQALFNDVNGIFEFQNSSIVALAEEHGISEDRAAMYIGAMVMETKQSRAATAFNGWQSAEIARLNEGVPPGNERWNIKTFLEVFGDTWKDIPDGEKALYKHVLQETRDNKVPSARKIGKLAIRDVSASWATAVNTLNGVDTRTGYVSFLLACKSSHESYAPASLRLSPALEGFTEKVLNMSPGELLHHMEAYAVEGLHGVATSTRKIHSVMKKEVTGRLLRLLRTTSGKDNAQMMYDHYYEKIVLAHEVDLVGWPFDTLKNPSRMSRPELKTLHTALYSDPPTVFFVPLTNTQLDELVEERNHLAESVPHDILLPYVPHRTAAVDEVSSLSLPASRLPLQASPPSKDPEPAPTREETPFEDDPDDEEVPNDQNGMEHDDNRADWGGGQGGEMEEEPQRPASPSPGPSSVITPGDQSTIAAAASIIPLIAPIVAPLSAPLVAAAVMAAVVAAMVPSVGALVSPLISPVASRVAAPLAAVSLAPFALASALASLPASQPAANDDPMDFDTSNVPPTKPSTKPRKKRGAAANKVPSTTQSKPRRNIRVNAAASGSGSTPLTEVSNSPPKATRTSTRNAAAKPSYKAKRAASNPIEDIDFGSSDYGKEADEDDEDDEDEDEQPVRKRRRRGE